MLSYSGLIEFVPSPVHQIQEILQNNCCKLYTLMTVKVWLEISQQSKEMCFMQTGQQSNFELFL